MLFWILVIAAAVYLFLIMPRMFRRPDLSMFAGRYFAHRGLYDNESDAPENSMKAFGKAAALGFGIEFDVHLTKDRIPVVFHDFPLERMCHVPGHVEDYTFEELQAFPLGKSEERIPKLADVLSLVGGRVPLIIEYKSEDFDMGVCEISDALLREYHGAYCVESFNPFAMGWYRKHRPEVIRGQLSENYLVKPEMRRFPKVVLMLLCKYLLLNVVSRPDFIAYNCLHRRNPSRVLTHVLFHAAQAAWTVRSSEQLQEIRKSFDVYIFERFCPSLVSQRSESPL